MNRLAADAEGPRLVDAAFAALLQRLDPATDPQVLRAARQAMHAVSQGHAALDLQASGLPGEAGGDVGALVQALRGSRWVEVPADPDSPARPDAPLVLSGCLLYLRRYYEYERRLAAGLLRVAAGARPGAAAGADEAAAIAALAPLFARLFPHAHSGDDQARAAALALLRSLLLVTGGPGTGKTTTLARLLVLLIARHRLRHGGEPPRIALAAPTGRAADRMAQSLAAARAALHAAGVDQALLDALPAQARTLHRLLGPVPDSPRFRHDAAHPLAYDVVVVDEASMVDLPLMCKLVEAVPDGARLVLVGDPDQLPSVEAGDVLASIVRAAGEGDRLPPGTGAALAPLFHATAPQRRTRPGADPWTLPLFGPGAAVATEADASARHGAAPALDGHRVHLRRAWRQTDALDLAPLAEAVRGGDAGRALALLQSGGLRGVHFHPALQDPLSGATRERLLAPWRAIAEAADPRAALEQAARLRLLAATRSGPQGAVQLNARIEEALAGAHRDRYFHGRLLLVTENSYRHGLYNGDIGVCLRDDGGAPVAWFAGGADDGPQSGGVRGFHPGSLPAHEGAFAMTVHKAQGSEFDSVWLLLPARDNRVLSRELVYTALTRARRELHVAGSAGIVEAALARHVSRWSGLGERLAGARR